jgi:hypothetical protein
MHATYSTYDLVKAEEAQRAVALERRRLVRGHRAAAAIRARTERVERGRPSALAVATITTSVLLLATLAAAG